MQCDKILDDTHLTEKKKYNHKSQPIRGVCGRAHYGITLTVKWISSLSN